MLNVFTVFSIIFTISLAIALFVFTFISFFILLLAISFDRQLSFSTAIDTIASIASADCC